MASHGLSAVSICSKSGGLMGSGPGRLLISLGRRGAAGSFDLSVLSMSSQPGWAGACSSQAMPMLEGAGHPQKGHLAHKLGLQHSLRTDVLLAYRAGRCPPSFVRGCGCSVHGSAKWHGRENKTTLCLPLHFPISH